MSAGYDYGRGLTNIDHDTGIRYGVISQGSVLQAWADSSVPIYACEASGTTCEALKNDPQDPDCTFCEPVDYIYEEEGYVLQQCLDTDIMVIKSPFYTYAPFCSPCVPGAGNLDDFDPDGVKTYCLLGDWFDDQKAPYPVYSVETNLLVGDI